MLFILVSLENNGSQGSIALNALRGTYTAVFGAESTFEEVIHVILDASRRFGRIVIQVVDVDVSQLVGFGKTFRQQIFICIVFGYFRGECHHLSGGSMTAHIGVAQVDIVFVNGYDTVHHMLHLGLFVSFGISPFPIDDVLFGYFRTNLHQLFFYQVLNFFYRNGRRCKLSDYIHRDVSNQLLFIIDSCGTKRF